MDHNLRSPAQRSEAALKMRSIAIAERPVSAPPTAITALPPAALPARQLHQRLLHQSLLAPLGPLLRRWWPAAALVGGGWLVMEASPPFSHWLSGGPSFTLAAGAAGMLWLLRPRRRPGLADTDLQGWLTRLEGLLPQFEALDAQPSGRSERLIQLRQTLAEAPLRLAVVGLGEADASLQQTLAAALPCPAGLILHWADPLPRWSAAWRWPAVFERCDLLIHRLQAPLLAAELRWLEAMPEGQPAWLLVSAAGQLPQHELRRELEAQLPQGCLGRLLLWDGDNAHLAACLEPLAQGLRQDHGAWRQFTRLRLARQLHGQWQADLELLRRERFDVLLQRTQWLVAAGVVAAPLPSLDLLVLAVANGLMLQEMARLWQCPWTLEQLRTAAAELARAALALGVVEWSSQSLAGLLKVHGATWLLGGASQALSAAYLTRVVGCAMADVLALSSGVSEPDLERLKREAPLIVARAADSERLDWQRFLQQGRQWLREQAA